MNYLIRGGSAWRRAVDQLLLLAIVLDAICSTSILQLAEASCSSDVGSSFMSSRSLLQAPVDAAVINSGMFNMSGVAVPAEIAVPERSRLLGALWAVGHQHYTFNGTAWVLYNATAWLYEQANMSAPLANMGPEAVVGVHFFLAQPDAEGGQPSWRLGSNRITAKGVAATTVDSESITWNLLQATSYQLIVSDSPTSADWSTWVGEVTFVQRLNTQRGLPPATPAASSAAAPSAGDTFSSVYAALYAFYADSTSS